MPLCGGQLRHGAHCRAPPQQPDFTVQRQAKANTQPALRQQLAQVQNGKHDRCCVCHVSAPAAPLPTDRGPASEPAEPLTSGEQLRFPLRAGGNIHVQVDTDKKGCTATVTVNGLSTQHPVFLHWCAPSRQGPAQLLVAVTHGLVVATCAVLQAASRHNCYHAVLPRHETPTQCRGLFRGSAQADWLCPKAVVPRGSTFQEKAKAIHTPLLPVHDSRAVSGPRRTSLQIPASAVPASLACKVYVADPERPHFCELVHGTCACTPLGFGVGSPQPLGAHIDSGDAHAADHALAVNFAVTSRHACAPPRTACLCVIRICQHYMVSNALSHFACCVLPHLCRSRFSILSRAIDNSMACATQTAACSMQQA